MEINPKGYPCDECDNIAIVEVRSHAAAGYCNNISYYCEEHSTIKDKMNKTCCKCNEPAVASAGFCGKEYYLCQDHSDRFTGIFRYDPNKHPGKTSVTHDDYEMVFKDY